MSFQLTDDLALLGKGAIFLAAEWEGDNREGVDGLYPRRVDACGWASGVGHSERWVCAWDWQRNSLR